MGRVQLLKPRIHFHTDCPFFAGCENMLAVLFTHSEFREMFDVTFSYGYSARYEKGFRSRVRADFPIHPLRTSLGLGRYAPESSRWPRAALVKLDGYLSFPFSVGAIYRLLRRVRPDILHINNGGYPGAYSCSAAVFAARLAGIRRIVYVVNNVAVPRRSFHRRMDFWMDGFVSRKVNTFVTASAYAGQRLREVLGLREERALTLPNTILSRFPDESPSETRARLHIGADEVVIGCVAVQEERKGQRFLIEAFDALRKELQGRVPLRLVLEGTGSMRSHLERLVRDRGLVNEVIFCEERNVYNLYQCLDLLVLPSIGFEDFPNVILEVMSLGKPVIGTRVAGIPEQIRDGYNGYVVEPKDTDGLCRAMRALVTDPNLRETMGRRSRELFEANFQPNVIVGRYIELYRSLMEGGKEIIHAHA